MLIYFSQITISYETIVEEPCESMVFLVESGEEIVVA